MDDKTTKKFRQKYQDTIQQIHQTKFAIHLLETIKFYDSIMAIIGASKSYVFDDKIQQAEE